MYKLIIRVISTVLAFILLGLLPVSALSSDEYSNRTFIGTYTEENKNQVIADILANDPHALVFTSVEEYEKFVSELTNITLTEYTTNIARSYRANKHLQVNVGGLCYVNVYYDYFVDVGGVVYEVFQDSVYSSMTGYSPGVTYQENALTVRKTSDTHIGTDLTFSLTYYFVVDNIIELGSDDFRYQFDHNCCTDTTTFTQVY